MQAASVPPDEPARLKAVRRYEKLLRAAHDAGEFDDCAKLAAQLCGTPISLVTVVGEDTQWFLSAVGLDVEETPRDVSFCAHTILGADLFEVRDTHTDERFHDNPLVTGDPGVRFYAGAPLVTPSGHRLGTVCVIDREPRQLTLEQREALARLATQVGKLMELLTVTKELETERNRLEQVMDAAAVAPWSFDVEEDLFTANDAFYSLCGTTAEREGGYQMTLASYTRDFVHPDDLPLIERERALLDSAPSDSVSRLEHRIVRRDGEVRHVLGYYRLSKDAAGRMTGASGSIQDITDRKRAEERVHELNTRLEEVLESRTESLAREQGLNQLMLESLGAGVAACDADGRLILFNQAAREWHGTDPTDIPPEEWAAHYDLYEGDGVTPLAEERIPLVRALSGETISNIEMAIAREGIAPRDLLVNGGPLDDKDGSRLGAVVVMHDVTELKRADEMLRVKHRQLVQAESSGEVGSFEFDLVSGSLVWTEGLHRIYGVDPETFSPGYEDFISRLHPDDRDRVAATISRAIEGTEEFDFEERIIRPGGEERVLHTRGRVAVGEEDGPGRVVGLCQDITDRVERDRLMRMALATLDATPDSATVFDRESLRFEYVNQGAIRQLGYTEEELLAMTPLDVKPEFDESSFRELLHSISESDSAVRQFTTVHRTKEGDDVPVEIVLQYVKVPSAAPRFITIARDISERLTMEHQARRSQRLEAIGTLAGGVAHDLNNALAPILLGAQLLRKSHPDESDLLDSFEISAKRGASMVRQLLTFAKGSEGKRVSVQVGHMLNEMRSIIEGSFPKNIRLQREGEFDPPTVRGDPTQIHQILLNLCVNARDAMPEGGTITMGTKVVEVDGSFSGVFTEATAGRYVVLSVGDTGVGMPPDVLDRIFDPFFTTKGPDQGTGLGLSTVVGIVKGHGGFVNVRSTQGKGSTFEVYLPVDEGECDDDVAPPARNEFRGSGETILVVDDESVVRSTAASVLEDLGFSVLAAVDGADGLIQASEHRERIEAVITDLRMPEMDGLTFTRLVRRILPDTPIVVASGQLDDETAAAFEHLGVTRRLDKPFAQAALAEVLEAMLSEGSV